MNVPDDRANQCFSGKLALEIGDLRTLGPFGPTDRETFCSGYLRRKRGDSGLALVVSLLALNAGIAKIDAGFSVVLNILAD